ncbi:MAG: glycosyltransferase family 4 protein [bacterium]
MNIVFQCNELPPGTTGGIGIFVEKAADYLYKNGHRVTVIGIFDESIDDNHEFKVVRLKRFRRGGLSGYLLNVMKFQLYLLYYVLVVDRSVDMIEYVDYEGFGGLHMNWKPFVTRMHNPSFHTKGKYFGNSRWNLRQSIPWILQCMSLKRSKQAIGVSHATFKKNKELCGFRNGSVIHNFLPFTEQDRQVKPFRHDNPYIVSIGTVNKKKGADKLIDAFVKVVASDVNLDLVFVGRMHNNEIRQQIQALEKKYQERIVFVGEKSHNDVARYIKGAELAVFPSQHDTFGLAWIEAMYFSKIVIVADLPHAEEIVQDAVSGFISSVRADDIAKAINHVVKMSCEERRQIAEKAYETVIKRFNMETQMERNIHVWESALR